MQVLLTEEEFDLVSAAGTRASAKLGRQGRELLLAWAAQTLERPGAALGGRCGSSIGCSNGDAVWWNTAGKFYMCAPCATRLNTHTGSSLCVERRGDLGALTDEAVRSLRSRAEGSRGADDRVAALVSDIRKALAPYEGSGSWLSDLRGGSTQGSD